MHMTIESPSARFGAAMAHRLRQVMFLTFVLILAGATYVVAAYVVTRDRGSSDEECFVLAIRHDAGQVFPGDAARLARCFD